MEPVDRLGDRLRRATAKRERLLVVYLTLGDPLTSDPLDVALAAVEAGADVLELGIPTPSVRPRGSEIGRSFARAADVDPGQAWTLMRKLRDAAPATPILPLVYPATVDDLGWDRLTADSADAGADGLVLTRPESPDDVRRVTTTGLSCVPFIASSAGEAEVRRMEDPADLLTYRSLAARTGDPLDLAQAGRVTARLAETAAKPFVVGFGIRDEREIRALAPHAAGLVIGSRLLGLLWEAAPDRRIETMRETVRRWKAATVLDEIPAGR
ncbi:MAG: trpA [Sphaerisporangium sp.]|jgi:tryptophan synthase alpha chain|nr:trpA [Sphaerisporangium sp.]